MRIAHIRHLNRGDIKEGGCSMCKPRRSREDRINAQEIVEIYTDLEDNEEEQSNDT